LKEDGHTDGDKRNSCFLLGEMIELIVFILKAIEQVSDSKEENDV